MGPWFLISSNVHMASLKSPLQTPQAAAERGLGECGPVGILGEFQNTSFMKKPDFPCWDFPWAPSSVFLAPGRILKPIPQVSRKGPSIRGSAGNPSLGLMKAAPDTASEWTSFSFSHPRDPAMAERGASCIFRGSS